MLFPFDLLWTLATLLAAPSPLLAAGDCGHLPAPTAASIAAIDADNGQLGIPTAYARSHGYRPMPQASALVRVARDVYGREVELAPPAASALQAMRAAAARDGVSLQLVSGYRSIAYQTRLIRNKLRQGTAIDEVLKVNAPPGYSEHQTGCAIDLTTPGVAAADPSFAHSRAYVWLRANATRYGFHLSYAAGNAHGLDFEPWHWRYVASPAWLLELRQQY